MVLTQNKKIFKKFSQIIWISIKYYENHKSCCRIDNCRIPAESYMDVFCQ